MLKVADRKLVIVETIGGSYGTEYYHIKTDEELEPVYWCFSNMIVSKEVHGKKKCHKYKIPLEHLQKQFGEVVEIYEFCFTNSGAGPFCRVYKVNTKLGSVTINDCPSTPTKFKIKGPERALVNMYDKYVPDMISRIKEIEKLLGIKLFLRPQRLSDIYEDPKNARNIALIFPNVNSRIMAIKGYIQSAHELYVLMLLGEALNGETLRLSYREEREWIIEHAQDYPTAIVRAHGHVFTIWYQFSAEEWVKVVFPGLVKSFLSPGDLQKLAMEGKFEELGKILGTTPRNLSEAYKLIANFNKIRVRQHVKPDIVVFEGKYDYREELEKHPPERILLIDAKIDVTENDFKQLLGYKKLFSKRFSKGKVHYVIAAMKNVDYKEALENAGYVIIENVFPGSKGEGEFINEIRAILF